LKVTVITGVDDNIGNPIVLSEKVSSGVPVSSEIPAGVNTSAIKTRVKYYPTKTLKDAVSFLCI
jgi:hypothetical protein